MDTVLQNDITVKDSFLFELQCILLVKILGSNMCERYSHKSALTRSVITRLQCIYNNLLSCLVEVTMF